jgi:uncharacterized glyoxalase superfamily protein PhnB
MTAVRPAISFINLIVQEMPRALAFYRLLGLDIPAEMDEEYHARVNAGPINLEFDTVTFAAGFDPNWTPAKERGGRSVLEFGTASREEVDRTYERIVGAGYEAHLAPHDAFWGARYAIVRDPDGNHVGLMSERDLEMRGIEPPH